ncbi:MAG: cytochrome c [Phycisphaerae bacterium]|nr:cytochrome c [Phycisphaerae bacterium]
MTTTHTTLRAGLLLTLALCAGVMPACRGDRSAKPPRQFLPDMDDSPKWKPQTQTDFYADGRAMRPGIPGTVPFGASTSAEDPTRANYLKDDVAFYTGKDARGNDVAYMPDSAINLYMPHHAPGDAQAQRAAALSAMLARGEERFNIYCLPCHGYDGKGKGTVGQRFAIAVTSLHEDRLRDRNPLVAASNGSDGHIFDVIRNGWNNGNMPGYGHAVPPKDAWAIVLYVRALQATTGGSLEDVPEAIRSRLLESRPPQAAPATPATPAPAPAPAHAPASGDTSR